MYSSNEELLEGIKESGVEYVDIRFCDLPGVMQHFSIPASAFDESVFEDGLAFDGSSVRGFQSIDESDMMLLPDPATARIDPFRKAKTMNLSFFVHDPFTREAYSRDPRNVARKAEDYLASTGVADTCFFGAEAEFYIFDSVAFGSEMNGTFYEVESESGWWNTGQPTEPDGSPNLGYKVRPKGGYFPVAPYDHYVDLRDQMSTNLINAGFTLERGHHEVGTAGQAEINYKFNTLLAAADASAYSTGHIITTITDALTTRLIHLAEVKLGPPPVDYVWVAAGSQARSEQTARSDQDNCMVLDDRYDEALHGEYFRAFSQFVCDGLAACGYIHCPGEMMAMTDKWRQPRARWAQYFHQWVDKPEPMALMLTCVFFDLRAIHGKTELLESLRRDERVALIFISHDLSLVRSLCDRVLILRGGNVVESGDSGHVFAQPRSEYTRKLLNSIPLPVPDAHWLEAVEG